MEAAHIDRLSNLAATIIFKRTPWACGGWSEPPTKTTSAKQLITNLHLRNRTTWKCTFGLLTSCSKTACDWLIDIAKKYLAGAPGLSETGMREGL